MQKIVVSDFEGPLDLLLTLITEKKIDILDIPIAEITEQYNEIIASWSVYDLAEVSEYLVMAARLIRIKSQILLPRPSRGGEQSDPRMELTNQLVEYKALKEVADYLRMCEEEYARSFTKDPEYFSKTMVSSIPEFSLIDLERALRRILSREEGRVEAPVKVEGDKYDIRERMESIICQLKSHEEINFRNTISAFPEAEEVVVTFLAVLELFKVGELDFYQSGSEISLVRRQN